MDHPILQKFLGRGNIVIKIITDYIFVDEDVSGSIEKTLENISDELRKSPELLNLCSDYVIFEHSIISFNGTPLMVACQHGSIKKTLKIVELLLNQRGILVNEKNQDGWTALMFAACYDNKMAVELLLNYSGILVNEKNPHGWTALMFASCHSDADLMELLLGHPGILVNEINTKGQTALMLAFHSFMSKKIIELLLSHPEIDLSVCTFSKNDEKKIEPYILRVENRKLQKQIDSSSFNLEVRKKSPYPGKNYLNSFVEEGFEINENFIKDYFEETMKR